MIQRHELESSLEYGALPEDVVWTLPNKKRNPYYIVAPPYVRTSAGIKVLHLLCHALNRMGERAYILPHRFYRSIVAVTNPELNTPVLDKQVLDYDFATGQTPIVIYPEVVYGNPFHAPFVVRYVMNFPGLLGGETHYHPDEFCVAYSEQLAQTVANCRMSLFFPVSDPRVFTPFPSVPRKGSCFYAGKYKYVHGGKTFDITANSTEITRDMPESQTPEQIAALFRRSEVFYVYENTALAIEAILCGCPVVFLPNPWLTEIIGVCEHGMDGIAWGTGSADLARARATVVQGRERYLTKWLEFREQLEGFIEETQETVSRYAYAAPILVPQCVKPNVVVQIREYFVLGVQVWREKGFWTFMGLVLKRIVRALT